MVVVEGFTVILAVVSPVLHKKSLLPVAVKVILSPEHMVTSSPAFKTRVGLTVTITSSSTIVVHSSLLEVTLNVVVSVGFTVILEVVSPVLHKKLPSPLAVKVTFSPEQTETSDPALTEGN